LCFVAHSQADIDAWYVSVVKKLKNSHFVGPEMLDALVTSVRTADMAALDRGDIAGAFEGSFSNRWTELVTSTSV
jgi:hypothetical protein